jgi:DNA primase
VLQSHAYIYRRAPGREPKYKYTEDFKAHNTLYGLPDVKLGKDKTLILVEGPLDCLWLRQYGYKNSLAIMGGSTLGMEQRRIIKEDLKPKRVILAYDNDEAGQALNQKSADALRGIDCYAVRWEGVEWPDEDEEELTIVPNDVAELDEAQLTELLRAAKLTAPPPRKAFETSWIARTYRPGEDGTKKRVGGRSQ